MALKITHVLIFIKPTEAVEVLKATKLPKWAARKSPWKSRGSLYGAQVQEEFGISDIHERPQITSEQ